MLRHQRIPRERKTVTHIFFIKVKMQTIPLREYYYWYLNICTFDQCVSIYNTQFKIQSLHITDRCDMRKNRPPTRALSQTGLANALDRKST